MKANKERKRWGLIIFLVFIMIGTSFSFVFFGFSPAAEKAKYNGHSFTFSPGQNIWLAKINGKQAAFSFLPKDVENIPAFEGVSSKLIGKFEIDVTSDSNSTHKEAVALAQHQMGLTLSEYGVYLRKGFTANNTFNLPIITCDSATANVPVINFRYGNATNIHIKDNCIIAEASANTDFIKAKDRLLYIMFGVMK